MTHIYRQVHGSTNLAAAIENQPARLEGFVIDTALVNTQQQWQLQEMINAVADALFESRKGRALHVKSSSCKKAYSRVRFFSSGSWRVGQLPIP